MIYRLDNYRHGFEGLEMKKVATVFFLALAVVLSISLIAPAQARVTGLKWLSPIFNGNDPFLGVHVVAFRESSTASLVVAVDRTNPPLPDIELLNVSAVKVNFDWGINYTSPDVSLDNPVQLNSNWTIAAFTITFTVPPVSVASNMIPHTYKVYVEYVNATTGPKSVVGTFIDSPNFPTDPYFAVYSNDQADAELAKSNASTYTQPSGGFSSSEARILWAKGTVQLGNGDTAYLLGDFASAKGDYQNAVTFYEQAYTAEATYNQDYRNSETDMNTAQARYYDALSNASSVQADAAMKEAEATTTEANAATTQAQAALRQADAALTNAYGWMAFGIGWILIGIGVIIYGLRRPRPPVA
jgi:hypothetical protein